MKKLLFPKSRLSLIPQVEDICRADYADDVAADPELDLVAHVGEWHMESVSEAGYSETSKDDRLSMRAFARIFRCVPADLQRVKDAVGWNSRHDEYREFGFASLFAQILQKTPAFAPALKEAHNGLEPKAPYGRGATLFVMPSLVAIGHEYQMEVGDLPDTEAEFRQIWLAHMVNEYQTPRQFDEREKSMIALASVLRVGDVDKLIQALNKAGLSNVDGMQAACAETIIGALRNQRAFNGGVNAAQA
ncbi:MAG: hypothetical protein K2X27_05035 [Candidatus Obscuribacterales bacterium]|nr:hypothetical protein [Candidatus Obscuribacterales bacterium]